MSWRRELLGRAFEDLLYQRLELPPLPAGAGREALCYRAGQDEVDGELHLRRLPHGPLAPGAWRQARPLRQERDRLT